MNWANFINSLQENANNKQKITDAKEEVKRLLNEKEIQLCCLLKANFSTKEISIVTQQGIRTVYQRKTVIRQKLGIEEKGDIAEYLSTLSKKEPL
jgi:DNA-binding CsgD family transcriptional regulator